MKKKVEYIDADKLKTVPINLRKLNDVADKNILKKPEYNKLNSNVTVLETKIPIASNKLIHKNQYSTYKQSLEKIDVISKNIPDTSG